jgi:putative aldouronate transport system substrate-binding protein
MLVVVMVVGLLAVGSLGATGSSETGKGSPVTLTWGSNFATQLTADNLMLKELQKRTGITLDVVDMPGDKQKAMYAAGETLDLNTIDSGNMKTVLDGALALPLDALLKSNGKDMVKYHAKALGLFKTFMSNGGNVTFFTPSMAGDPTQKGVPSFMPGPTYLYLRWDWYKEIGAPPLATLDDLLAALVAIQKAHPTTKDGLKVYGLSGWPEWGPTFNFSIQFGFPAGMSNIDATHELTSDNTISCTLTDPKSVMWQAAEFYYKANRAGVLDPDFFINKYADYVAKYKAGQLLTVAASWQVEEAKASVTAVDKAATYVGVPLPKSWPYNTAVSTTTWTTAGGAGVYNFIGKSCKNPERAMDFLNALATPDAARLLWSGVKGTHWDVVNGTPAVIASVRDQRKNDKDFNAKTGIGWIFYFLGAFAGQYVTPDGGAADLFNYDPSQYALQNNEGDKAYSAANKVAFPGQVFSTLASAGTLKPVGRIAELAALLPSPPSDIQQIDVACVDYFRDNIASVVLAKDDAAFAAARQGIISGVKKLGADTSDSWWQSTFATVKANVLAAMK